MEVIVEASVMRVVTTVCRPSAAGKTKYWGGVGEGVGEGLGTLGTETLRSGQHDAFTHLHALLRTA